MRHSLCSQSSGEGRKAREKDEVGRCVENQLIVNGYSPDYWDLYSVERWGNAAVARRKRRNKQNGSTVQIKAGY